MREQELIIYGEFEQEEILHDMAWLMSNYKQTREREKNAALLYSCMHRLLEMAGNHGFYGNLWHCYLSNLLVNNENSYSTACEIVGEIEGTINDAVLHDFEILKEFYDYDFTDMVETLKVRGFELILDYRCGSRGSKVYNTRIRDRICELASKFARDNTPSEMKDTMTAFYKEYGIFEPW